MPDPITPAAPATRTIDLEPVVITGSVSKPEPPPLPWGDIAGNCFDEADAVAVVLLTRSPPNTAVAALATLGIAYDFAACVGKTITTSEENASIARALARCSADGGTPVGLVDHALTCNVVVE